jgi:hypothetical protein
MNVDASPNFSYTMGKRQATSEIDSVVSGSKKRLPTIN